MEKPPPPDVERLVRYCHPAKILASTRLPGLEALDEPMLARLYGVSRERYGAVVSAIRAEAVDAARVLGARLSRVDGPVLALGDSHTDDLASWAEILAELLDAPVINAGLSGDTTTAALARAHRLPEAAHAFVLLGTNDARRHGGHEMLVSNRETRRNMRAIDTTLRQRCGSVCWITPPPVDPARVRTDPALVEAGVTWRLEDVAAKAAVVRAACSDHIDLWPHFGPEHLAPDGLHPSVWGQRLIAEQVLRRLASGRPAT
jgi:acyl-CoA thioesterase I